jgi:hypothetical protein
MKSKEFIKLDEEIRRLPISPEIQRICKEQEVLKRRRRTIIRIKGIVAIAFMPLFVAAIHSVIDLTNKSNLYLKLFLDSTLIGYLVIMLYFWVLTDIATVASKIKEFFKSPLYSVILWSWPISMLGGAVYLVLLVLAAGVLWILHSLYPGIEDVAFVKACVELLAPFLK